MILVLRNAISYPLTVIRRVIDYVIGDTQKAFEGSERITING
jgi:hypothetical protein